MEYFVERAAHLADLVASARSRKAFLTAVADFERMMRVTLDSPRWCFELHDLEALRVLADGVIERIEARVESHADRAAVELLLVTTIYRIRQDVETMYSTFRPDADGNPSRNTGRRGVVSPSR